MHNVLITSAMGGMVATAVAQFATEEEAAACVHHINQNPTLQFNGPYQTATRKAERLS